MNVEKISKVIMVTASIALFISFIKKITKKKSIKNNQKSRKKQIPKKRVNNKFSEPDFFDDTTNYS